MFDFFKIISFFKKSLTKRDVVLIFLLVFVFFLTRLIYLDRFPLFSDEGIYIRWAKSALADPSWRFISLTDGKQPLQTWGTMVFLKLIPENAVLAARLFAVFSGFAALVGIFIFTWYLFGKRAALFGSLFYILTPYFLFYDRIALVDSAVNASYIWLLFFAILMARTLRLDVALITGLIAGKALLAKSSAQIAVGMVALSPLLFLKKNLKDFFPKLVNFLVLYVFAVALAVGMYSVQRLSPFYPAIAQKNTTFVMTPSEFLQTPFAYFATNAQNIPIYVFTLSAIILPILGLCGLYLLFRKDSRLALYLAAWIVIPYLLISFFSKILFPRHVIFLASILLVGASYFIITLKNKKIFLLSLVFYFLSVSYFDYTIVADYKNIPFPQIDRNQYLEEWPAGWGAQEIVEIVRVQSKEKPAIIIAEGNFGMAADVLSAFITKDDRITVEGYWPLNKKHVDSYVDRLQKNKIYVVFSHRTDFPGDWPMKKVFEFKKPGGKSALYLFELTTQ